MNLRSLLASFLLLSFTASSISLGTISAYSGNENGIAVLTEESSQSPELLNPVEYGFSSTAQEVLSKRTLNTATFSLGGRRFAQVSVSPDLFTKDENGNIVKSSDKGIQEGEQFVFDRLPQNTQVRFNLTRPAYTMTKDGQEFTLAFQAQENESISGEILNDHQIAYQLSETARLVWTVDGGGVKKEIYVKNTGTNPSFIFQVQSGLQKNLNNGEISFSDEEGNLFFKTEKPFFMTKNFEKLEIPLILSQVSDTTFSYIYDESLLPDEYILDPNQYQYAPGTLVDDSGVGSTAWQMLTRSGYYNLAKLTLPYETAVNSHYLKGTNFNFSVPDGSTIDGILLRTAPADGLYNGTSNIGQNSCGVADVAARIVKGGTIGSTNRSSSNTSTNWYLDSTVERIYGSYTESGDILGTDLWGETWTSSDINSSGFGAAIAISTNGHPDCGVEGDTPYFVSINYMYIQVFYTEPELGSTGDSCTADGDCASGFCLNGNTGGVCVSGCPCGGSPALTLPSGYVLKKQSDFTTVNNPATLTEPTKVYIVKTDGNIIVAGFVFDGDNAADPCAMENLGVGVNSGKNAAYVHAPGMFNSGDGKLFTLYVPNQSGNSVNICNGATSAACNTSVTTTRNTQGYSSGIDYRIATVQGTQYKIVTGLSSTSIEEAGSGGSAPEFSIPALMLTLAGSLYIVHRASQKGKTV